MRRSGSIALACVVVALLAAAAPPAGATPPGANDWNCRPPEDHPAPVILVHGTFLDADIDWATMSPALARAGYCVFALDLPRSATARMERSAQVLSDFTDRVLAATGARKVSYVGHSQGGMLPRYVVKFLGKLDDVDDLIGIAPSNHGTSNPLTPIVGPICPACIEQETGSPWYETLNAPPEAPPPISYTTITTRYDEVVIPYTSGALHGDADITNVVLQDECPRDFSEHLLIPYDPVTLQWVLDALGREGPADPDFEPDCDAPRTPAERDAGERARAAMRAR